MPEFRHPLQYVSAGQALGSYLMHHYEPPTS
jgi:hypothetical protein